MHEREAYRNDWTDGHLNIYILIVILTFIIELQKVVWTMGQSLLKNCQKVTP